MEKITFSQMESNFFKFNKENGVTCKGSGKFITGVIVYKESNWEKKYSLESRSYRVSSDNKAFIGGQSGYSIYGDSLDETDIGVRLEHIGWDIDYCYME